MSERTPRGRAAVAAWPDRLARVEAEPTDDNLQRLCTLLDAIDHWVVLGWDRKGHDERLSVLLGCRQDARRANRAVTDAMRAGRAAKAASGAEANRLRLAAASPVERPRAE